MTDISDLINAKTWRQLGLPRTKDSVKFLQRNFHPDVNTHPDAHEAFTKIQMLFDGPDFDLRVAKGTVMSNHMIVWEAKDGFKDRVNPAVNALGKLANVKESRFFPRVESHGANIVMHYGPG